MSEKEPKKRIKLLLAMQLYKIKNLSIGKAAQISGLSRLELEHELSDNHIPISNLFAIDVMNDIDKLPS